MTLRVLYPIWCLASGGVWKKVDIEHSELLLTNAILNG
jgi:hypothetical protein